VRNPNAAERRINASGINEDYKNALLQIKKDQDDAFAKTSELLRQVGNTQIKIAADIGGTLNIVASTLSPEATKSLQNEIVLSVSKIIDDRIKAQNAGIKLPPLAAARQNINLQLQAERDR
jgi:hypothetical protein